MFLINSRGHPLSAALTSSARKALHQQGRTFFQSYGAILPSSFTRVISRALVFSTCLPVSVCGTDLVCLTLETFLGSLASVASSQLRNSPSHLGIADPDFPKSTPYLLRPGKPTPGQHSLLRHPFETHKSTGILTCFPSTTPFGLALGPD